MRYKYYQWDSNLLAKMMLDKGWRELFNYLLLQANGDVDRALSMMRYFQEIGVISNSVLNQSSIFYHLLVTSHSV